MNPATVRATSQVLPLPECSRGPEISSGQHGVLAGLVVLGAAWGLYYFSWWWYAPLGAVGTLFLAAVLAFHIAQVFIPWGIWLSARRRPTLPPEPGLTVDVFVVAYKEPIELIEKTLRSAVGMRYPHQTHLLDDSRRPVLAQLARRLGAGYITRPSNRDAKAGNINHALGKTGGEIIVILDADHVPRQDFLEQTLGQFRHPGIAFVQTMLTFSNADESQVARAAGEMSSDFFNVTSLGMDACGSATLFGSNALIRRAALDSIGGYRPGLAEDLATSIELHAAGWHSAFVRQPLAPGLSPADLNSFFVQQFKWSRGVFEVLFSRFPRLLLSLTLPQALCYLTRMTFYTSGWFTLAHLWILWLLLFGGAAYHGIFLSYLIRYLPFMLLMFAVEMFAVRCWSDGRFHFLWRAVSLLLGTWPIYVLSALSTLIRYRHSHMPTPKQPGRRIPFWTLLPQFGALAITIAGLVHLLSRFPITAETSALTAFGLFLIIIHSMIAIALFESVRSKTIRQQAPCSD